MATASVPQHRFVKEDLDNPMMPVDPVYSEVADMIEPAKFCLRVYNREREFQQVIPLKKYVPTSVGRAIGCQIDLADISISRRHCVFQYKELTMDLNGSVGAPGFCIYDFKSTHGTYLNGERISSMKNIHLNPGDKIRFGLHDSEFVFQEIEGSSEPANPTVDSTTEQQVLNESSNPEDKILEKIKAVGIEIGLSPGISQVQKTRIFDSFKSEFDRVLGLLGFDKTLLSDKNEEVTPKIARKRGSKAIKRKEPSDEEPPAKIPKKRGKKKKVPVPEEALVEAVPENQPVIPKKRGRKPRVSKSVTFSDTASILEDPLHIDQDLPTEVPQNEEVPVVKPKRKRRTKAEMAEARRLEMEKKLQNLGSEEEKRPGRRNARKPRAPKKPRAPRKPRGRKAARSPSLEKEELKRSPFPRVLLNRVKYSLSAPPSLEDPPAIE